MKFIKTDQLRENNITTNIYSVEVFSNLLDSINRQGILEPLIVRQISWSPDVYEIISGLRRYRVAKKLNLTTVPVVIKDVEVIDEALVVEHQNQRIKKPSELLREIKIIQEKYGLKQGVRTDKNEKAKEGRHLLKKLETNNNKGMIDKLKNISKLLDEIYGDDEKSKKKELNILDSKRSISGTQNRLKKIKAEKVNKEVVGDNFEISTSDIKIYNKSSETLEEIDDNSISLIITSPPYFKIRNYGLGDGELGQDNSVDQFVERLANHFDESKRVLSLNGTMWVNLGDYVKDYEYGAVPEKFLIKMLNKDWMLHDRLIWMKNNPQFSHSNRSVNAHEIIYVFKKNPIVHFNAEWIKEYPKKGIGISIGNVKLRSVFDFRNGIIKSNTANNARLRTECEGQGIYLTHSATFPLSIPTIALMTCTKPGETVLDVFNGTGTAGRAAQLFGRKYIGYDLSSTYIQQSEVRLNMKIESDVEVIKEAA